jgi:hypothetical protein
MSYEEESGFFDFVCVCVLLFTYFFGLEKVIGISMLVSDAGCL